MFNFHRDHLKLNGVENKTFCSCSVFGKMRFLAPLWIFRYSTSKSCKIQTHKQCLFMPLWDYVSAFQPTFAKGILAPAGTKTNEQKPFCSSWSLLIREGNVKKTFPGVSCRSSEIMTHQTQTAAESSHDLGNGILSSWISLIFFISLPIKTLRSTFPA